MNEEGQRPELSSFLRVWLKRAVDASGLSREILCAELTKRLGRAISVHMLETWLGKTKRDWHIPADAVPALAEILQDDGIQRQLLNPKQRNALELGESAARLRSLLSKAAAEARELARKQRGADKQPKRRR